LFLDTAELEAVSDTSRNLEVTDHLEFKNDSSENGDMIRDTCRNQLSNCFQIEVIPIVVQQLTKVHSGSC
jgi:hypothetical protein